MRDVHVPSLSLVIALLAIFFANYFAPSNEDLNARRDKLSGIIDSSDGGVQDINKGQKQMTFSKMGSSDFLAKSICTCSQQPDTGVIFKGVVKQSFCRDVYSHRHQNCG